MKSPMTDATIKAAIDIGTNSVLLLIAQCSVSPVSTLVPLIDRAQTVRLGEGLLSTGALAPHAIERTLMGLKGYLEIVQPFAPAEIICFGTEALRRANNTDEFRQQLKQDLGLDLRLLSPAEEAFYTFKGALSSLKGIAQNGYMVVDIGGGSTEVVHGTANAIDYQHSFPIGAVVAQETFRLVNTLSAEDLKALQQHARRYFKQVSIPPQETVFLLTGGTATTMAALALQLTTYDVGAIDGYCMTFAAIQALYNRLNCLSLKERAALPGMEPGRADIILPAMVILMTLLRDLKIDTVQVSVRGARYGILF